MKTTTAYIDVSDPDDRVDAAAWPGLLALLHTVPTDTTRIISSHGPYTPHTPYPNRAVWAITLDPAGVVPLQSYLSRVVAGYPGLRITWAETRPRDILATTTVPAP